MSDWLIFQRLCWLPLNNGYTFSVWVWRQIFIFLNIKNTFFPSYFDLLSVKPAGDTLGIVKIFMSGRRVLFFQPALFINDSNADHCGRKKSRVVKIYYGKMNLGHGLDVIIKQAL